VTQPPRRLPDESLLRVRTGHGANCSSVGSVVDTLFASAAVGSALFAAIVAALQSEPVRVVGRGAKEAEGDAASQVGSTPPEAPP
jgi:hypothetical protein